MQLNPELVETRYGSTYQAFTHQNDLFTVSLCHGPGAFLSTTLENKKFIYVHIRYFR